MVQVPFGDTLVSRSAPLMPASAYSTYGMLRPLKTHFRPATCEEAGCKAYRSGWVTTVDLGTELGQRQYHYISHDKTRSFTVQRASLTLVKVVYPPGNRCFRSASHKVSVGREPRFIVAHGDWRGYLERPRAHTRAEFWVEEFSEHADRLVTTLGRG